MICIIKTVVISVGESDSNRVISEAGFVSSAYSLVLNGCVLVASSYYSYNRDCAIYLILTPRIAVFKYLRNDEYLSIDLCIAPDRHAHLLRGCFKCK